MGTDISIHIEYKHRKKKKYVHAPYVAENERTYEMFHALAGIRSIGPQQVIEKRGLPGDVTKETYNDLKGNGYYAISWVDTHELKKCIDEVVKDAMECTISNDTADKIKEDMNSYLKSYIDIYNYMKELDDGGEPSRMVFGFDC